MEEMTDNRINAGENSASPSILTIRSLEKSFGSLSVLKDISLSVERGNVISIIGPSGSGKSTLLRCATFLEKINAGEISLAFAVAVLYMVPPLLLYLYGEDDLVEGISFQGSVKT